MSCCHVEDGHTVIRVPRVVTAGPRQLGAKWCEQVIHCPANDGVVVHSHVYVNQADSIADTYKCNRHSSVYRVGLAALFGILVHNSLYIPLIATFFTTFTTLLCEALKLKEATNSVVGGRDITNLTLSVYTHGQKSEYLMSTKLCTQIYPCVATSHVAAPRYGLYWGRARTIYGS